MTLALIPLNKPHPSLTWPHHAHPNLTLALMTVLSRAPPPKPSHLPRSRWTQKKRKKKMRVSIGMCIFWLKWGISLEQQVAWARYFTEICMYVYMYTLMLLSTWITYSRYTWQHWVLHYSLVRIHHARAVYPYTRTVITIRSRLYRINSSTVSGTAFD